jgi:hypothetical protein
MKNRGFQFRSAWLVRAALLAVSGAVLAQPAEKTANKPAAARTKPQVIYHLPSSSDSAATLHSQAKGQNNSPPAEGPSVPPQISRGGPSASASPGRQEAATPTPKEQRIKRSKPPSNRSARPQSSKTKGHVNSPPNKAQKK